MSPNLCLQYSSQVGHKFYGSISKIKRQKRIKLTLFALHRVDKIPEWKSLQKLHAHISKNKFETKLKVFPGESTHDFPGRDL